MNSTSPSVVSYLCLTGRRGFSSTERNNVKINAKCTTEAPALSQGGLDHCRTKYDKMYIVYLFN